jgi:hypothetical protein
MVPEPVEGLDHRPVLESFYQREKFIERSGLYNVVDVSIF